MPRRRSLLLLALVVASCTSSQDVTSEQANAPSTANEAATPDPTVSSEPPTTDPAVAEPADDPDAQTSTTDPTPDPTSAPSGDSIGPFESVDTVAPDPSGLPSLAEIDPQILVGETDNGLRYLIRRNDNPGSRVQMRLAVDAGAGVQDPDQGGGAHFLEHMLFNGTERFPANELIDVLRSFGSAFGADVNAYTNSDETVYELTMPTEDPAVVSTGLDVLQQWLSAATIDQEEVVAERGVILDEWRRATQTGNGRYFQQFYDFLVEGTRFEGRRTIGEEDEISSTSSEELRRFYDTWYRPDNAAVVVVGDIDPADIEAQIIDRFGPLEARAAAVPRPDLTIEPSTDARALVVTDPDLQEGFGFVALPLALDTSGGREAQVQRSILDGLAFSIIDTRLSNDALRGDAPFDTASVSNSNIVRSLDAPEIFFTAPGVDLAASAQAVLDEYERVRRFGFTDAELMRAIEERRSAAQVNFDGRFSRQDASYADEYVRHFLEGESLPTAQRWFDFVNAVLDGATTATVAHGFVERFETAGVMTVVGGPQAEADEMPSVDDLVAQVDATATRPIEPRADVAAIGDTLMSPPTPVDEVSSTQLADGRLVSFVAPTVLTFPNDVVVSLNRTPISEGVVILEARSPGGLSVVADDDVADAVAAASVVDQSGVADFDPVALEAFLSDKEVSLDAAIENFTEGFGGFAATSDIETLFQLIHLSMTEPRLDQVALDRYLDDQRPLAEDPSINANYASFVALLEARYDDPRYLLPTVESLDSVDAADTLRVFEERFGDATDWVFSFSGDLDVGELTDLARTYLGSLPSTGRAESVDYVEPAPPPGVVTDTVRAGDGQQASIALLFGGPASTDRRDDVAARVVNQVIQVRLTDAIREELGESYSPFARFEVSAGATPTVEAYVQVSTAPDLVDQVTDATLAQLADLRANGPSAAEFSAAVATLTNELELFSNQQINDEILDALVDPAGNTSFDDFLQQAELLATISAGDVQDFIRSWLPEDSYIAVTTLPR